MEENNWMNSITGLLNNPTVSALTQSLLNGNKPMSPPPVVQQPVAVTPNPANPTGMNMKMIYAGGAVLVAVVLFFVLKKKK